VDLYAAGRASSVRRDCRAPLKNLLAKRVLFAFARAAGEDYAFRLINPGMAASGRRFGVVDGAAVPIAPRSCANCAAMIPSGAPRYIHLMSPIAAGRDA
jgi:hypothetical protein